MTDFESWHRRLVAGRVVLTSPNGPAAGVVRIRRDQPARPLGRFLECGDAEVRRLTTDAGELAAIATLCDPPLQRLVGAVAGRLLVLYRGVSKRARSHGRFAEEFEALVKSCSTGDDPLRRRMYAYRPPPGWHGVRRAFSSCWHPPRCPRDRAIFEVFDALPHTDAAAALTHDLMIGPARQRTIISHADESFTYELHYIDPDGTEEHREEFARLVSSVEDLPGFGGASVVEQESETFAWTI